MMAVKICGLTRREDVEAAAEFGASHVGFVLWLNSPRSTTLAEIRDIIRALPVSITPVGVFVDPTADEIAAAGDAGVRLAQVHGEVPVGVELPVVRAVHLSADGIAPPVDDELVLLDAHDPVQKGGTGKTIDWRRAAGVARARRVILAGGLTPENVAHAIAIVRPFGVDVASGVEAQPGVKDHARMRAFIAAAKGNM